MIIQGKLSRMIVLPPQEEISPELLETLKGGDFVQQGLFIYKVVKTPFHVALVSLEEDFIEKHLNKFVDLTPSYDPDLVHMLTNTWDNLKFSDLNSFVEVMKYFKDVYNKHGTESCVLLYANPNTNEWKVLCPMQIGASGGSVVYLMPVKDIAMLKDVDKDVVTKIKTSSELNEIFQTTYREHQDLIQSGYVLYGTIHSHCDFGAFHSGTDDHDEQNFDGLHVTVGNCNSGWSFSCRYMAQGGQFETTIQKVLQISDDEIALIKESADAISDTNENWMSRIRPELGKTVSFAVTGAYSPPSRSDYFSSWWDRNDPANSISVPNARQDEENDWENDIVTLQNRSNPTLTKLIPMKVYSRNKSKYDLHWYIKSGIYFVDNRFMNKSYNESSPNDPRGSYVIG